MFKNKLNDFN